MTTVVYMRALDELNRSPQEETRRALGVHKAHLACLVARCAMVSRWAGDPTVQAAMVSCLPGHLLSKVLHRGFIHEKRLALSSEVFIFCGRLLLSCFSPA